MNKFEVQGVIGEGAYGTVLKCRNKITGEIVAIKKFKDTDDSSATQKTKIRELKLLRMLKQDFDGNIVILLEAFRRHNKLYLVFEYCDNNVLEVLEGQPHGLAPEIVRKLVYQLLKAIEWCHRHDVIHRDIKPENLLVNRDYTMKLCDFGFARQMAKKSTAIYTDYVATRWYRAPELLLGSTSYGLAVDVWAVACIMGELTDGQPLFPGKTELDQLFLVQRMLGPLTKDQLEMFEQNPRFLGYKFPSFARPSTLERRYVGKMEQTAIQFMKDALQMDPRNRVTAREALMHPYFDSIRPQDDTQMFMAPPQPTPAPSKLLELPMAYVPPGSPNQDKGMVQQGSQSNAVPVLNPPPGSNAPKAPRQRGSVPRPDSAPRHIGDATEIRQYRAATITDDVHMPPVEGSSLPPPVPSMPADNDDYDQSARLIAAAQGRAQRRLREAARKHRQGGERTKSRSHIIEARGGGAFPALTSRFPDADSSSNASYDRKGYTHHRRKKSNERIGYEMAESESGGESDDFHDRRATTNLGFTYLSLPDKQATPSRSSSQTSGAGSDDRDRSKDGSGDGSMKADGGSRLQPLTVSFEGAQAAPAGHHARPSMVRRAPRQQKSTPKPQPPPPVPVTSTADTDVFRSMEFSKPKHRERGRLPAVSHGHGRSTALQGSLQSTIGPTVTRRRKGEHPLAHLQIKGASGSQAYDGDDNDSRRLLASSGGLGGSGGLTVKAFGRSQYSYAPGRSRR